MVPFVIDNTGKGERTYDIYSRLLRDRIIFVNEVIDDDSAGTIIAQLLFLQLENKSADISMYIMSPGGSVTSGFAIYDAMQHVENDVATYCVGQAASMGAVLLAAGTKGKRFALPNSRIMLHQPWGGAEGDARSIKIQAREITRLRSMLYDVISEHTGQPAKKVVRDCDRDFFMSAEEAVRYGIVDEVLGKPRRRRV